MSNRFLLEAKNIIKTFPPTVALNDVHFCLRPGEIHGLMGENGSGKSTMCSIVSGIYPYDSGELFLEGEPYCPKNIVSDAPNMSKENMSALKAYVEDGGIAYISGHSAQPLVEEIFGGKITGRTDETITYIAPEDEVAPLFGEYSRKYPLTVYDSAYILEGATNGKVLAKLTLPYSLQASSFLVCADLELQVEADPNDPRNESASMHSDPPGIATDYPAMMEAEVGKGKIIWACAPFESTSLTQPRKVFTSFVKKYVPEMSFASDDTPYVVEYQLWEDEEGKYLSAINLQYADEVLPVFDFNICIRTEKPAKITRVSDGREMGFEYSDGKLVLHIDRLDLYEMFDIQI